MELVDIREVFQKHGLRATIKYWRRQRALEKWCARQDHVLPSFIACSIFQTVETDGWALRAIAMLNRRLLPVLEKVESATTNRGWWMLWMYCILLPRDLLFLIAEPKIVLRGFVGWPLVFAIWGVTLTVVAAWPQLLGQPSCYTVRPQRFVVYDDHRTAAEIANDDAKIEEAWSLTNGKTLAEKHRPCFFQKLSAWLLLSFVVAVSAYQFARWLTRWSLVGAHIFMYIWYAFPLALPQFLAQKHLLFRAVDLTGYYQTVTLPHGIDANLYDNQVSVVPFFVGFAFLASPFLWAIFAILIGHFYELFEICKDSTEPQEQPQPFGDAKAADTHALDEGGL